MFGELTGITPDVVVKEIPGTQRGAILDVDRRRSITGPCRVHWKDGMRRMLEARYPDPLPVDDRVAREWGRLQAAVARRGGSPRGRNADLAIAATANVHDALLVTHNLKDFKIIEDLVRVSAPERMH